MHYFINGHPGFWDLFNYRKEGHMAKEKDVKKEKAKKKVKQEELDTCQKSPEFAEHERFEDSDEPCDDSRGGKG